MSGILKRSAFGDFYASEVAAAVRMHRLLDPDYAIASDPEWYEKAMRDAIIYMTVNLRSHAVAGAEWFFEAASKSPEDRKAAELMTAAFKKIERFTEGRSLLARAFLKGSTWAKKHMGWITVKLDGLEVPMWSVVKFQDADKRRFRRIKFEASMPDSNEKQLCFFWEVHNPDKSAWEPIDRTSWVRHVYTNEEIGLGYGRGIAAPLYFLQWWKSEALTHGMSFLSRWSEGMVVGTLDNLAEGVFGAEGTAEARATDMLNALEKMRAKHYMVMAKGDSINVLDPPAGAWSTVDSAVGYADENIRALVLGAVLPTGGGSDVGSFARAESESGTTDEIIQYDRGIEEETIQAEVVNPVWEDSHATREVIGLGSAACPQFRIARTRKLNPETAVVRLEGALRNGMSVKREEAYRDLAWSDPGPDADPQEILQPISAGSDLYLDPMLMKQEMAFEEVSQTPTPPVQNQEVTNGPADI